MCGFSGIINLKENIENKIGIIEEMDKTLIHCEPNETGYYTKEHCLLLSKRLIVIDPKDGEQLATVKHSDNTYTIVLNGKIYNTGELQEELTKAGFTFDDLSDTEVLLKSYIYYGEEVVNKLNGVFAFAIWNEKKQELFMARDHFGVKPFYYTRVSNNLIFSSEIKAILKHPEVKTIVDQEGLSELFGLGPAHTPGTCIFKDIYELKPAHFAVYNKDDLFIKRYWKLESKPHTDNLETTCEKIKSLLADSIQKQLGSDVPLCTFLSGGLDSSIITKFTSDYYEENNIPPLNTFSVDYLDNDKNFIKSDFEPNSDKYYINIMTNLLGTKHETILIDTPELSKSLEDAMIARDFPGMADVDSSLLLFCKNVKEKMAVALSGECADEVFGGYPWFFREDALSSGTFPWSIAIDERQKLLNPTFSKKINLKEYIDSRYKESLNEVEILDTDTLETAEKRKIFHLNLNWFMQTLLDRTDRMATYSGFEVRVPFCDYRLVQYVWNIPWEMKAYKGREKGLLRYIMEEYLPEDIVYRKKSPYPKTHNPNYLATVKGMLTKIMENTNSPIHNIVNKDYVLEILKTDGEAFTRPWFGQLMTGPQLMAYLVQVNMWLERYKPEIRLFM